MSTKHNENRGNKKLGLEGSIIGSQSLCRKRTLWWHLWYNQTAANPHRSTPPLCSAVGWTGNFQMLLLLSLCCRRMWPCAVLSWYPYCLIPMASRTCARGPNRTETKSITSNSQCFITLLPWFTAPSHTECSHGLMACPQPLILRSPQLILGGLQLWHLNSTLLYLSLLRSFFTNFIFC